MAELLASSSTMNDENQLVSTKPSQNDSTSSEIVLIDSPRVHSKLLHRRIVTMLETLRKPNNDSITPSLISNPNEVKSQPITFGQLRQATISSIEDKPTSQSHITEEKHHKNVTTFIRESAPDVTSITINTSSSKHSTNKERLYYSPSLEQLFEQQNKKEEETEEQIQKSSLTVDEILTMYYTKVKESTHTEPSSYPNTSMSFYIHPSSSSSTWNSSQNNQNLIPPPPRLVLNEQNRNRPPPPSYSSSVAIGHRPTPTGW
jgi:hypothetical protein